MGVDAVVGEAEVLCDSVGDLLVAVGEGEAGAGVSEALGDDGAEAAAGSGDCDDASVEVGAHEVDAIRVRVSLLAISPLIWFSRRAMPEKWARRFVSMERVLNRRQQGDLGEISAVEWLTRRGALALLPVGHSPDFDLVAQFADQLLRIQVKTSTQETRTPNGHLRYPVSLVTNGGNQSWSGVSKVIDKARIDYLFVLTAAGRRWFIPSTDLEGKRAIQLGGAKYAEYEIDRAPPIRELVFAEDPALDSKPPGEYPSGQRTATVNRLAQPSQVRILPPPSGSDDPPDSPATGRTRMSANHQVCVPLAVASASSIKPGDRFRVESDGTGRFVMTRVEEYMERHLAQLAVRDDEGA